ncbi:hypothetical protein AB838_06930 [Rhodobacteraceae bacterium (ex Bugula neritina AB1)]|nr:hypothetical protein AB838_06930 [Rhodobacteraceae bacterium (ex Bugula neritina AB1)]
MTQYRPEIDGLRAIAVGAVILFHAGFGLFSGGYIGVDVFFVISGYLITGILLNDLKKDRFSIWQFYERRARRILPALVFVLVCCLPFAWAWMYPGQLVDFAQAVLAVVFFVSNILFWRQSDYFAPDAENNPLLHTWSLAVEEQFYIFFPILLWLIWRWGGRGLLPTLIVISLASLGLAEVAARVAPGANFYLIPTRAWELLAGSICAVIMMRRPHKPNAILALIGLAMVAISIFVFDDQTPFPSLYAVVPVAGTALIVLFAGQKDPVGRLLCLRGMIGIGLVSYSAYLWHQPLLAFARIRLGDHLPTPLVWGLIAATFVLAYFSWRFVEQPFRAGPASVLKTRRGVFTASGLAMAALIGVGLVGVLGQGMPGRMAPSGQSFATLDIENRLKANRGIGPGCAQGFNSPPENCRMAGDPQVLLWGDSFAMHLGPALKNSPEAAGIVQYTIPVCAPIMDISLVNAKYAQNWARGCIAFNDEVLDWLRATPSVSHVVMSSPLGILRGRILNRQGQITTTGQETLVLEQMRATGRAIRAAGAVPVFVAPPPRTGADLAACGVTQLIFGISQTEDCSFAREDIWEETHEIDALLAQVGPDLQVLSLADLLCKEGRCATLIDGTLLFRDKGHFSNEGAALLGRKRDLLSQIRALE